MQYASGIQIPGTVYRVVRHLATGGMGSVYDVEDVTVGKRYVLKTLHPNLVARQDLAKRMSAEARTLARLQHPNIVDVVTAGITQDDARIPFYVMERLNGQNLRVVIEKKGPFELTRAYRVAIDVLEALEHAHEHQVIHRDVKPENIFLHRNPSGTTITKLLDFGIMRLLDRKASHTQGKFVGTLRYASPEQIMGEPLGPPTDLYSLGLVLYEMICGRGPFDDLPDALAIGAAHAQRPPPPLSRFRAGLPPELEALVMASIAKDPAARPKDGFSFASELRRMLREEEEAPRSTTVVNVLTYAPETQSGAPLVASAEPAGASPPLASAPLVKDTLEVAPPTEAQRRGTDPAAHTVTSYGPLGTPQETVEVRVDGRAVSVSPARDASLAHADTQAFVDRGAETRAGAAGPRTQRLPMNGTEMDDGGAVDVEALRTALGEVQRLEVPPESFDRPVSSSDIRFPPSSHGSYPGTGPTSGEGATRPPERGLALPILGAALVILLVGGAGAVALKVGLKRPAAAAEVAPPPSGAVEAPAVVAATTGPAPAPPPSAEAPPSAVAEAPPASPAPAAAPAAPRGTAPASRLGKPSPTPRVAPSAAAPTVAVTPPPAPTAPPAPAPVAPAPRPAAPRPAEVPYE